MTVTTVVTEVTVVTVVTLVTVKTKKSVIIFFFFLQKCDKLTQIVTKLKNSICDLTQKLKLLQY